MLLSQKASALNASKLYRVTILQRNGAQLLGVYESQSWLSQRWFGDAT